MHYWIVIANSARAKVFLMSGWLEPLQLKHDLEHPAGRARAQDIVSDQAGRYSKGGKHGTLSAFESRHTPHENEERKFAKQIAELLELSLERKEYEWLAIFAPAQFLGILREDLSNNVRKRLAASTAKDLIDLNPHELHEHLSGLIPVPISDPAK